MITVDTMQIDNGLPLVFIAGPCVIENYEMTRTIAAALVRLSASTGIRVIFKASYDKANRTSINSFRGLGLNKGIAILKKIKEEFHMPITTDVHSVEEASAAAEVCDIIQIPAFLCRQTDLLCAAGKTQKAVNIKKGQFTAPEDMKYAIEKVASTGNTGILITERGYSFGYHNLVVDMRSLEILKSFHYPVIYDATHSVQLPGGGGKGVSGGQKQFVFPLARAAAAIGIAGIFVEIHPRPSRALSDGPNSIAIRDLAEFVKTIMAIDQVVKKGKQ